MDVGEPSVSTPSIQPSFSIIIVLYPYKNQFPPQENMRSFDMENVAMTRKGSQYLTLEVPGLAEKRPSLIPGDYVTAMFAHGSVGTTTISYQVRKGC